MFEFALKGDHITKATENAVVAHIDNELYVGDVTPTQEGDQALSKRLRENMVRTLLRGIIHAAAYKMFLRGVDKAVITEKIVDFVDTLSKNKDIASYDASYFKSIDWFGRADEKKLDRWELKYRSFRSENEGLYAVLDSIWEATDRARDCYLETPNGKNAFDGMTEQEKTIITNFIEARDKFYEAERAKQALLGDTIYDIIKNIVTKYTQDLVKLDVDVYTACCKVSGVEIDETVVNTATNDTPVQS